MNPLNDIVQVAGGNKDLSVSIEKESLIWTGVTIFIAVTFAVVVAGIIGKILK